MGFVSIIAPGKSHFGNIFASSGIIGVKPDMMKLVNWVVFLACALAVGHICGWGSSLEVLAAVVAALCLMRVLSRRRRLN